MLKLAVVVTLLLFAPADKETIEVRKLDQNLLNSLKLDDVKMGTTLLASQEEVTKQFGKDVGAAVAKTVDFTKEDVVYVGFQTSGPPFGQIKYNGDVKAKKVEFYLEEPKVQVRGQALKLGRELYVVPKGTKVTFGSK